MRQVQGYCDRCASCCGLDAAITSRWRPGISFGKFAARDISLFDIIKTAYFGKYEEVWNGQDNFNVPITITGGGPPLNVTIVVTPEGLKSVGSNACPFLVVGTPNACSLMANSTREQYLPVECTDIPQGFTKEFQIVNWEKNHIDNSGLCKYYWT